MDECIAQLASGTLGSAVAAGDVADTELDLGAARQLSQALERRLDTCKAEMQKCLSDNRATYTAAVTDAAKAQDAIEQLLQGVDDLQALLGDDETGIGAQLAAARGCEARVGAQLRSNSGILRSLQRLASLNAELQAVDGLVRARDLGAAAEAVVALEASTEAAGELEGARIKQVLADRLALARLSITDHALEELGALLVVEADG
ncbi:hypothetical protein LPJ61_002579, partial [Coemansia biformis]